MHKVAHLEDLFPEVRAIYSTRHRKDGRRLPCSWRSIEEQVGQPVFLDELLDYDALVKPVGTTRVLLVLTCARNVMVRHDVVESHRPVLLHPVPSSWPAARRRCYSAHSPWEVLVIVWLVMCGFPFSLPLRRCGPVDGLIVVHTHFIVAIHVLFKFGKKRRVEESSTGKQAGSKQSVASRTISDAYERLRETRRVSLIN